MTTLLAGGAIAAIWAAGLPATRLLGLRGLLAASVAWLAGSILLTLLMLGASAVDMPFSRPLLACCWCLVVGISGLLLLRQQRGGLERPPSADRCPPNAVRAASRVPALLPVELLALTICIFQVVFTLLQAVRVPLGSFDSWSLWEYKGRLFWLDRTVSGAVLHDHAAIFAHPAYPPTLPLLMTWVYTWTGIADPVLMKPIYPIFLVALLLAVYSAMRPRLGRAGAGAVTAVLSLIPRLADYAGTGLADVPLTAALAAGGAALVRYQQERHLRWLVVAGCCLAFALLLKRDALFFSCGAVAAVAVLSRSWRGIAAVLLPVLVLAGPWYLYVRVSGVPDRDFLPVTPANAVEHLGRVGEIARLFALNLLALDEWNILWMVFVPVLLLALLRWRIAAPLLLLGVVLPLMLAVLALSLSAWPSYQVHARTSLDRLILLTVPFALWFIAEQIRLIWISPRQPGGVARAPEPGTAR
jgi:hypothetical protein